MQCTNTKNGVGVDDHFDITVVGQMKIGMMSFLLCYYRSSGSSMLQSVAVYCRVLQCVAVCCSVLQCVAVCCSVLQCVTVCCSVLQCVAGCCSVLYDVADDRSFASLLLLLKRVAVCCSMLQ